MQGTSKKGEREGKPTGEPKDTGGRVGANSSVQARQETTAITKH
jgi:hypothetical protein